MSILGKVRRHRKSLKRRAGLVLSVGKFGVGLLFEPLAARQAAYEIDAALLAPCRQTARERVQSL